MRMVVVRCLVVAMLAGMIGAAEENVVFLPGAAATAGVGGTQWRSDLQVLNTGGSDLELTIRFLPFGSTQGIDLSSTVGPGRLAVFGDVVSLAGARGAGTLELLGNGPFLAGMRTFNQTGHGTFGQFIAPSPFLIQGIAQQADEKERSLPGVREDGLYRSNVGIFNPGDSRATFTIGGIPQTLESHLGWQERVTKILAVDGAGDTLRLGGDPVLSYLSHGSPACWWAWPTSRVWGPATGEPTSSSMPRRMPRCC